MSVRILAATDIPMSLRRPHLARYRSQLRDALMHPGLSEEQKGMIREKLNNLGQVKPYAALAARRMAKDSAFIEEYKANRGDPEPEPGAVKTTEATGDTSPTVGEDLGGLLVYTKDELIALAETEGVEVYASWTKAKIAEVILDHRNGA